MKIAIGADHAGLALKWQIATHERRLGKIRRLDTKHD